MNYRKLAMAFAVLPSLIAVGQVISVPAERELKATKSEVVSLTVAPKGDRLLVGLDKGAELYDLESGKRIFALPYNEDGGTAVYYVAFNENGEYAVLIGHSGKRVVWSMKTGKPEPSLVQHRWVPDPRAVKAMGLDMSNSTFDRFYQQVEVKLGDRTLKSSKGGMVNVLDADGKSLQELEQPDNKDQHHVPPVLLWQQWLLTGTDDGRVLFYAIR